VVGTARRVRETCPATGSGLLGNRRSPSAGELACRINRTAGRRSASQSRAGLDVPAAMWRRRWRWARSSARSTATAARTPRRTLQVTGRPSRKSWTPPPTASSHRSPSTSASDQRRPSPVCPVGQVRNQSVLRGDRRDARSRAPIDHSIGRGRRTFGRGSFFRRTLTARAAGPPWRAGDALGGLIRWRRATDAFPGPNLAQSYARRMGHWASGPKAPDTFALLRFGYGPTSRRASVRRPLGGTLRARLRSGPFGVGAFGGARTWSITGRIGTLTR
jgi:hypothetical protein